jgi:hypothetical protein
VFRKYFKQVFGKLSLPYRIKLWPGQIVYFLVAPVDQE